jgi:hypothetical protein
MRPPGGTGDRVGEGRHLQSWPVEVDARMGGDVRRPLRASGSLQGALRCAHSSTASVETPAPCTTSPTSPDLVPEGRRAGRRGGRTDRTQEGQLPSSCRLSAQPIRLRSQKGRVPPGGAETHGDGGRADPGAWPQEADRRRGGTRPVERDHGAQRGGERAGVNRPAPRDAGDGASRGVTGSQLAQARAAALVVDVQTKRLVLEQRRGALISRDRAVLKAFSSARTIRDAIQAWAARRRAAAGGSVRRGRRGGDVLPRGPCTAAPYRARQRARRILTRVAFRPGFTQRGCTRKGLGSFP